MPRRLYKFDSPELVEFTFNCMYSATKEQLSKLSANELVHFETKNHMRRFAANENLDHRFLMLARLGIPVTIFAAPRTPRTLTIMEEIITQYDIVSKRKSIMEAMRDEKIFALCTNDVYITASMAAQNSHGQIFIMNPEYPRLLQNLRDRNVEIMEDSMNDARKGFDLISKIILNVYSSLDVSQSITGVTPTQLAVLLALYQNRHTYVTLQTLITLVQENRRGNVNAKMMTEMEKTGLVTKLPGKSKNDHVKNYTIAINGIQAAMTYMKYITDKSL